MDLYTSLYVGVCLAVLVWHVRRRRRLEHQSAKAQEKTGAAEPASLHPVISDHCIGCSSCIKACPEQAHHTVLGLLRGRAHLVSPGDCIGHGACKTACPVDAITLVFGSERRGVDIPLVTPAFESTVPGIFIAGELGGMGLIRNALEQGRQVIEAIAQKHRPGGSGSEQLDVLIVGAGPAGFSASLTAKSKNMRYVTIEQESLGGAVFQYPRGKLVMTAPATVPLLGKVNFRQTSKEALLEFWTQAERKTGVKINYKERVEDITRSGDGFIVKTNRGTYPTRSVLLAIGRRGTPRKLGVPGEEMSKVVYRLIDPEQYKGQHVLVVGGGDSALEAAASIAETDSGGGVVLSYRGAEFDRAKARNRDRVQAAAKTGRLQVMMKSNVKKVEAESVSIEHEGEMKQVRNDAIIVSAGGVLPSEFLKRVGIAVETKHGTA
ncbi:MAG: 4Fe-4S dicluster domain-containing protein [Gammaproteobacteria bacterium]|nr:MAG: 4Fe-4S dicluster domain-containing protein [Gammaproteobacteria bacterium]TLZ12885.1 MAG: 4Fe-4S dicluster domain-containing protein [Gammaproteobacteria bacterium]